MKTNSTPTDDDLFEIHDEFFPMMFTGHDNYLRFARALLERFGQPAMPADAAIDSVFEAVRKQLCTLPRYSFMERSGGVSRVHDRVGNWMEFDQVHALFDPINVDAARRHIEQE